MSRIIIIGSNPMSKATGKGFAARGHSVTFSDQSDAALEKLRLEGWKVCTFNMMEKEAHNTDFYFIAIQSLINFIRFNAFRTVVMSVGRALRSAKQFPVVMIQNNISPGTTRKLVIPSLERHSGKKAAKDFGVCVNPRFLRAGKESEDFQHPPLIVIGSLNKKSASSANALYAPFHAMIAHTTIEEAEIQKYIHNLFNACKISFFNEMRVICKKVNADPDVVFPLVVKSAEALYNPLYGTRDFGSILDNHLTKDVAAFLLWSKKHARNSMPLLQAIMKVNERSLRS